MNISKQDQKLILILLGLIVFLVAYFGICKTFNAKKADEEAQIASLSSQVEELNGYYENQASNQAEIDRIDAEITTELSKYPSEVRSEDMVMFSTKLVDEIGITLNSVSIASPELVTKLMVPNKTGTGSTLDPVVVIRTGMTISCSLSYNQLKKLLNYVYASSEKTDVSNVSVNFDSQTGNLLAVITIEKYFIASSDYSYTQTDIPSVATGITNPFGTLADVAVSPTPSPANNAG